MLRVVWPTDRSDVKAQVWRVLDLSGMTNSIRESRNFTRSGFLYLNGSKIPSLKHTVSIGVPFLLELRFPNGKIKSREVMLVTRTPNNRRRNTDPFRVNYKG